MPSLFTFDFTFPFFLCRGLQSRHGWYDGQYSIPVKAHIFVQLFHISSTSSSNFRRHQTVSCTFPSIRRLETWHSHGVAWFRSNGLDISWMQPSRVWWMSIVTACACACAMNRTKTESPSQRFINNMVSECGAREIHRNDITLDISVYGRLGCDSIFTAHAHPFVQAMSSPIYCVWVRFFSFVRLISFKAPCQCFIKSKTTKFSATWASNRTKTMDLLWMAKICFRSASSSSSSPLWLAACASILLAPACRWFAALLVQSTILRYVCEIMMTKTTTSPMGNGQYFTSFWQPRWLFHLLIWTPEADARIFCIQFYSYISACTFIRAVLARFFLSLFLWLDVALSLTLYAIR